jgi:hypothetical protein
VTLTCQPVRLSSSNSNAIHARITGNDGANLAARLDQKTSGLRVTIGEHEGDPSDEGDEQSFQRTLTRRPRHSVDANGFEWPRSIRPLRLLLGGCDMRPAVKKKHKSHVSHHSLLFSFSSFDKTRYATFIMTDQEQWLPV